MPDKFRVGDRVLNTISNEELTVAEYNDRRNVTAAISEALANSAWKDRLTLIARAVYLDAAEIEAIARVAPFAGIDAPALRGIVERAR